MRNLFGAHVPFHFDVFYQNENTKINGSIGMK